MEFLEFRGESAAQLADKDLQRRVQAWSIRSNVGGKSGHLDIVERFVVD
jgi:hypothetical protein